MATPLPVTADEARAAIERIRQRRVKIDDPQVWRLSDDVVDALSYLRKYSQANIPSWVKVADVQDGMVLRLRLYWLGQEAELWLLESAQREGVPSRVLGRLLRLRSRQGPRDRLRAAQEKVAVLRGEPVRGRASGPDQDEQDAAAGWLQKNREAVRRVATALEEHRSLGTSDAQEWLAEVARDLRDDAMTPGSFLTVQFAAAELAVSSTVLGSPADHPVRVALKRWSELYDNYIRTVGRS